MANGRLRIQILVNGEIVSTIGVEQFGVVHASVGRIADDPAAEDRRNRDELHVNAGGLDSTSNEHLRWLSNDVQVGDAVTFRILPAGEVDEPYERQRDTIEVSSARTLRNLRRNLIAATESAPDRLLTNLDGIYTTTDATLGELTEKYEAFEKYLPLPDAISAKDLLALVKKAERELKRYL